MAVSKTRDKLVEVARQLFAKNGVEETTMNDIAMASLKGRRTLYTYFKSKEEIYLAVIESELNLLFKSLEKVVKENISPEIKILKLIKVHLDVIKEAVFRNGTLRAEFFRNIWQVESTRREFDKKEIQLICQILQEGKNNEIFDIDNVNMLSEILHCCIKGIEVPYIRSLIGGNLDKSIAWKYVTKIVFGALGYKGSISNETY